MNKNLMKYISMPFAGFNLDLKQNKTRHYVTFFLLMFVYAIGMAGVSLIEEYLDWSVYTIYGLTIVSIVALLFAIAEQWRFISNLDSHSRERHIKALLFGVALILSISASWGILETNLDVPQLTSLWFIDIFFIGYSMSEAYLNFMNKRQDKKASELAV